MAAKVKILFEYGTATPGASEVEAMWAVPVKNGYKIDNIPFYAREIALEDVVSATCDSGGMLRFDRLVEESGHSTVRLWFAKGREGDVPRVRQELRDLGCASELSDLPRLVAVDVPSSVPYEVVRPILERYEREGLLEYEEACLGSPPPA
jgi:hypothetical protein